MTSKQNERSNVFMDEKTLTQICLKREWSKLRSFLQDDSIANSHIKKKLITVKSLTRTNILHHCLKLDAPTDIIQSIVSIGGRDLVLATSAEGVSPLHIACIDRRSIDIIKCLVGWGGKKLVMMQNFHGKSALHNLFTGDKFNAQMEIMEYLIRVGGRELVELLDMDGQRAGEDTKSMVMIETFLDEVEKKKNRRMNPSINTYSPSNLNRMSKAQAMNTDATATTKRATSSERMEVTHTNTNIRETNRLALDLSVSKKKNDKYKKEIKVLEKSLQQAEENLSSERQENKKKLDALEQKLVIEVESSRLLKIELEKMQQENTDNVKILQKERKEHEEERKSLLERQKEEISDLSSRIKAMETEKKNAIDKLQSELSKQINDNAGLKAQLESLGKEKHDLDSQLCEMKLIKEVSASLHTDQRQQDDNINNTEERTPKRSRRTLFPSVVSPESQKLLDLKKKNEELLRIIENQAADHHNAMKQLREAYEKPYMDF
ncbi:predicted protein [Chaetoceros tenuissimus]|uniref:Uncharacterized protein n=1 Tax=Chaetoceros tenuissimus TaxID=426638 RepID=A0AAD3D8G3_9STRA|nr:predicted protein [Chaetoceros tenuissimus]